MSAVRVCAVATCFAAIGAGAATIAFAFKHPDALGMAGILAGLVGAFLGGATIKLLLRTKAESGTSSTPDEPEATPPAVGSSPRG
jgi:hypothetical protein